MVATSLDEPEWQEDKFMSNKTNQQIIADCERAMSKGLKKSDYDIDSLISALQKGSDKISNVKLGRSGNSRKNEMVGRPIIMYLWYLIKNGKRVSVKSLSGFDTSVQGDFLLVPMYDDEGQPTKNAIIPIFAKGDGCTQGEYQKIQFVESVLSAEVVEGEYILRNKNGDTFIDECVDHNEYLAHKDNCLAFNKAWEITNMQGVTYLAHPASAARSLIVITSDDGEELYQIVGNSHGNDVLNDPNVEKTSDGYITQDIIIPVIPGIGSWNKRITDDENNSVAYRASVPISRFMALASLFVSHEKYKDKLAADPDNDLWKRKARVTEWDMIEGFNRAIVRPFEQLFPHADKLKVLTLAIDVFIFTALCTLAEQGVDADTKDALLYLYSVLFGSDRELEKFKKIETEDDIPERTRIFKWLSYFMAKQEAWNKVPYVNHKDLRRSHNTVYNLEFTLSDFNDAHGALVGAFAGLPNHEDYVYGVTVPCRKRVDGKNIYSTKSISVFRDHYGISAYVIRDFDNYLHKIEGIDYKGQFIDLLRTVAQNNRKQTNSQILNNLVIDHDLVVEFERFLKTKYQYGTVEYWKWV